MKKFVLSTESTSDLPLSYLTENNVACYEMGGMVGDFEFGGTSGNSLDIKDFFNRMRDGEKTMTTQVNLAEAERFLESFLKQGKDVLHLAFSSALSGTYNNFVAAAETLGKKYPNNKVLVVDSRAASLGEGLFVHFVNKKAEEGVSIDEAYDYALSIRDDICHYFVVDDLEYLYRGGRVKKSTAVLGTLLRIKPVLHVDLEGRLIPLKKVMTRRKSLNALVDYMQTKYDGWSDDVFISHGDCQEEAEYVARLVTEKIGVPGEKILINHLGPVIGSHSGPGTVALFFHGRNKREDKED
ncbi:MAG TPA: DegV family protein [Firmicutes bacterium]|nr:DegV family protein [Bacillota bacterium]